MLFKKLFCRISFDSYPFHYVIHSQSNKQLRLETIEHETVDGRLTDGMLRIRACTCFTDETIIACILCAHEDTIMLYLTE